MVEEQSLGEEQMQEPVVEPEAVEAEMEVAEEAVEKKPAAILISWESPEFFEYQKTIWWFAAAFAIFCLLLAYSIWKKEWSMMIVFLIAAVVFFQYALSKPKTREAVITEEEVQLAGMVYPYKSLASFWIGSAKGGENTLYLKKKAKLSPMIAVRLGTQKPDQIKEVLSKFLTLEPIQEEDAMDKISRMFRF